MEDTDPQHDRSGAPDHASAIPNERLVKGVLATTIAASAFTIQIFLPALPAVQAAFDVTAAEVQLTISLPLLVTAVATLV